MTCLHGAVVRFLTENLPIAFSDIGFDRILCEECRPLGNWLWIKTRNVDCEILVPISLIASVTTLDKEAWADLARAQDIAEENQERETLAKMEAALKGIFKNQP